jgi:hypothetical protein
MSEPQHIGTVLPQVLRNIERRCNAYRARHGLPTLQEEILEKFGIDPFKEKAGFVDKLLKRELKRKGVDMKRRP